VLSVPPPPAAPPPAPCKKIVAKVCEEDRALNKVIVSDVLRCSLACFIDDRVLFYGRDAKFLGEHKLKDGCFLRFFSQKGAPAT
jgi:hypothetical protein